MLPDGSGVIMPARAFGASYIQIWTLSRDGSHPHHNKRSQRLSRVEFEGRRQCFCHSAGADCWQRSGCCGKVNRNQRRSRSGTSRYYDLYVAPDDKIVYASDASGNADIFEIGGWRGNKTIDFRRDGGIMRRLFRLTIAILCFIPTVQVRSKSSEVSATVRVQSS